MYEYKPGMDFREYYLEGYRWRIQERPIRKAEVVRLDSLDLELKK